VTPPLPGSQDETSILAQANYQRSRAARADLFARTYPEEFEYYRKLGVPAPEPPSRHDRERVARDRERGRTARRRERAAHERGEGREREAA
jgi:hypothetical protein